ncbi:MAG: hypothetical protein ACOYN5_09325 [Bacteroidales bacterium]
MERLNQMIPGHLLPQDGTSPCDEVLPELSPSEAEQAIMTVKHQRAASLGCLVEDVKLSDETITRILHFALERKRSNLKTAEYWKRVDEPRPLLSFTPLQMLQRFHDLASHLAGRDFRIDENNEQIIKALCCYFTGHPDADKYGINLSKGILLLGGVGCGKTTIMKAFSSNQYQSYKVISARALGYEFSENGFKSIIQYSRTENIALNPFGQTELGLCIDDLGTDEERKHYGEKVNALAEIILNRYDNLHRTQTHITSNLNATMIESAYGPRIRSRMREMFNVLSFNSKAPDRRI